MLKGKKIILGVTGGIAVYKACDLTSKLTQAGADVRVMMTEGATEFVSPLTFQSLSRNDVYVDTFSEINPEKITHIDVADWADIVLLAPATANTISKLANGISDNMLISTLLATIAPVYIAPAMNGDMYKHPAVIENIQKLADWGYHFIEPGAGYLACGYVGKGRLEEPATIIEILKNHLFNTMPLKGKSVLVSAGPTREKIDPVRFFSNRSTGKMGFAIAEAAANLGAEVTLVAGPVDIKVAHPLITQIDVVSAKEMYEAMHAHFSTADIVIKAAAVADYRPKITYDEKLKKQPGNLTIEMERTMDILGSLAEKKTKQYMVGFAAETTNALAFGKGKLTGKKLDAIVINDVSEPGVGFGTDTNQVTYVNKHQKEVTLELASKQSIARQLMLLIDKDLKDDAM